LDAKRAVGGRGVSLVKSIRSYLLISSSRTVGLLSSDLQAGLTYHLTQSPRASILYVTPLLSVHNVTSIGAYPFPSIYKLDNRGSYFNRTLSLVTQNPITALRHDVLLSAPVLQLRPRLEFQVQLRPVTYKVDYIVDII